jgi:hypothetical protein
MGAGSNIQAWICIWLISCDMIRFIMIHDFLWGIKCCPIYQDVNNTYHRKRLLASNIPDDEKGFKESRLQFVSSYRFAVVCIKKYFFMMFLSKVWFLKLVSLFCQMLLTCISILAVDFNIFPRRYAKAETYGIGLVSVPSVLVFCFQSRCMINIYVIVLITLILWVYVQMDIGVGSFVFANALVSRHARGISNGYYSLLPVHNNHVASWYWRKNKLLDV